MDQTSISVKVKKLHLVARKMVETLFAGNYKSVFRGPGMEFDEVRNYVDGDDSRFIDWNVSSRMNSPYVKTYREEREVTLTLLVDISKSLLFGSGNEHKRYQASFLAALLGLAAVMNNDKVGSLFFTDRIEKRMPAKKGRKHVLRLIQDIFSFNPAGNGTDISMAVRSTLETIKQRGIIIIISDFNDEDYWPQINLLARKHDVIAIRIIDELDKNLPPAGLIRLEDNETGTEAWAFGKSKKIREKYREEFEYQSLCWKRECAKHGIDYIEIDNTDDPSQKLKSFFEKRKRRSR